jgi:hypothetical protein
MPPSRGADRIGVSLGSHRPTVLLKLLCLVEKKRTKVRSLAVLFSAADWDRSPARPSRKKVGATLYENILPIFGDKGRNDLSIYLLQPRTGVVV